MGKTRKNYGSKDRTITTKFLEMLLMIKLYHWKTHSYPTHEATDELYDSLNEHMDTFVEVLLGKTGGRMNFSNTKSIRIIDPNNQQSLIVNINGFKDFLMKLTKTLNTEKDSDLLNIRDEILGDLNKFLYLLTFK
jgi:DNA-binding ferritin-like protein